MPAKANRCPHCWSALAADVTDFCPFCRGSIAPKRARRRGGETPEAKAVTPPPTTTAPYQPYEPYQRTQPTQPYEPYQRTQPTQPYEPDQPYELNLPAPAQPLPAAADRAAAENAAVAAPAGGGVAVAERDPVEFPGTPLPPGFFDALPERAGNPRSARISGRAIGVIGVVVVGAIGGISQAVDRNEDLSSPARHLVKGACAEYRDINNRLKKDSGDDVAMAEGIDWFRSNVDRFAEAARLDPQLAGASEVVAWFDHAIEVNFEPFLTMTEDEFEAREQPLAEACSKGPGRA